MAIIVYILKIKRNKLTIISNFNERLNLIKDVKNHIENKGRFRIDKKVIKIGYS